MADPIEFSTDDDGAVHIDKLNQFAQQVSNVQADADEVAQAVLDAQTAESNAAGSATAADNRANDADASRILAEEAEQRADYQVATIEHTIDLQRAQTAIARYGADQPHPGMDNQFQGAWMLDPRLTFSRPGAGWVMGPAGILIERGIDEPRFAYDPLTGAALGLLLEPAATNYVPFSRSFANWALGSGASANPINDARWGSIYEFYDANGTSSSNLRRTNVTGALPAQTMCLNAIFNMEGSVSPSFSVRTMVSGSAAAAGIRVNQDMTYLIQTAALDGGVIDLGDGWWWAWVTHANNAPELYDFVLRSYGETPGRQALVAYAWCHAGDRPMSYVETPGLGAVTRPADSLVIDMQQIEAFNGGRGAIVLDWTGLRIAGSPLILSASAGAPTSNDYLAVSYTSTSRVRPRIRVGGIVAEASVGVADDVVLGARSKVALRYKGGRVSWSLNGRSVRTLTNEEGAPQNLRYLHLGWAGTGIYGASPWFPHPLTDAQLQSLSAL